MLRVMSHITSLFQVQCRMDWQWVWSVYTQHRLWWVDPHHSQVWYWFKHSHAVHGSCTLPDECNCNTNWGGINCTIGELQSRELFMPHSHLHVFSSFLSSSFSFCRPHPLPDPNSMSEWSQLHQLRGRWLSLLMCPRILWYQLWEWSQWMSSKPM